jgi:CheY-like chemotaxis protein
MGRPQTFFIVDDDQDDIDLFREAVAKTDPHIQCRTFLDAQKAIDELQGELLLKPDVIFIDLNMPRVNGRQCLREIRKINELDNVPVVIYSTSSYEKDIEETRELGASHFFTKPSSFNDLCQIVSTVAEGRF